jgi:hypothetical protein
VAKKPPPDDGPRCGQCKHWRRFDGEAGECFFNPPVFRLDEDGYELLRPILEADEHACGQFKGAQ